MNSERIVLGNNCIYSSDPDQTGLNRNVLVVGASGSGKTVSFGEPELMETLQAKNPMNRFFICTKRRVVEKYMPLFRKAGFHVYDLNLVDAMSGNCCFDPIAYVKNEEDITEVAKSIVMVDDRKEKSVADPFWDDASTALMSAEIGLAFMTVDKPTFSDVLDIHFRLKFEESGCGISTSLDPIFKKIEAKKPDCYALNQWKTFKEAAPKTAKSIYVSMNPTLMAFTHNIRQSMKLMNSIDFETVAAEKTIIFVTTSPVKKSLHSLANIFVAQAIAELFGIADKRPSGALAIPTHITFDDFATGARVSEMPEKISICREKNLSFSLLLQSEAQIKRMYGEYGAIEIMDNCDSYVFMGGNNFETARSISLKMNVPLEEILYMPIGQEIVFRRGQKPIVTNRYDVQNDAFYQKITREYNKRISAQER
jgi:type IV secretory pathway TraG/TraD family ATPase VirD4